MATSWDFYPPGRGIDDKDGEGANGLPEDLQIRNNEAGLSVSTPENEERNSEFPLLGMKDDLNKNLRGRPLKNPGTVMNSEVNNAFGRLRANSLTRPPRGGGNGRPNMKKDMHDEKFDDIPFDVSPFVRKQLANRKPDELACYAILAPKGKPYLDDNIFNFIDEAIGFENVRALTPFVTNNVWEIVLKNKESKEKLAEIRNFKIQNHEGHFFDPTPKFAYGKIFWIPHGTNNDLIKKQLEAFGTEVQVDYVMKEYGPKKLKVETSVRVYRLRLKEGMTIDNIPPHLFIGLEKALIVT